MARAVRATGEHGEQRRDVDEGTEACRDEVQHVADLLRVVEAREAVVASVAACVHVADVEADRERDDAGRKVGEEHGMRRQLRDRSELGVGEIRHGAALR